MSSWNQVNFQDASSSFMEELVGFHDFLIVVLLFIMMLVLTGFKNSVMSKQVSSSFMEDQKVEFVWTVFPALILIQIALPSLSLLYLSDDSHESPVTVKVVGHQWYWSYEFSDIWTKNYNDSFDSYMVDETPRLLSVDNNLVLPMKSSVRALVSSGDVLHSWAVPALGVKADACPGRLNQVFFSCKRPGMLFGQCSEICGANHSFMPISISSLKVEKFIENM